MSRTEERGKQQRSRKMSGRMPLTPVSERESDSVSMRRLLIIAGLLLVLLLMLMNYFMEYLTLSKPPINVSYSITFIMKGFKVFLSLILFQRFDY